MRATGTEPLRYQWVRNGSNIDGATADTYTLAAVGQLDDRASFTVQVSNAAGSVASTTANLNVMAAMGNSIALVAGALPASPFGLAPQAVDGAGAAARFTAIHAMASDRSGNLYVVEDFTVRKVTSTGIVTTIAGKADALGATDGPASSALFRGLRGIAIADDGTIFLADAGNRAIRVITPQGNVQTLAGAREKAGSLDGPYGIAQFGMPTALALDANGALYVLDGQPGSCFDDNTGPGAVTFFSTVSLRRIFEGQVHTVVGSTLTGTPRTFNSNGTVFIPGGLAVGADGSIYMGVTMTTGQGPIVAVGCGSFRRPSLASYVRKFSPTGEVTIIAGSASAAGAVDGPATAARFGWIMQMAFDRFGALYVSDVDNRTVRRVDPSGVVTTPIGAPGWPIPFFEFGLNTPVESFVPGSFPGRLVYAPALAVLPNGAVAIGTGAYDAGVVLRTERR